MTIQPSEQSGLRYTEDYNLGDRVLARIRGIDIENIIRGVKIDLKPSEDKIQMIIGPPDIVNEMILSQVIFGNRTLVDRVLKIESS